MIIFFYCFAERIPCTLTSMSCNHKAILPLPVSSFIPQRQSSKKNKKGVVTEAICDHGVEILGLTPFFELAVKDSYLNDQKTVARFVQLAPGEFDFIQNFRKADLKELKTKNPEIDIAIVDGPCKKGFSIWGQKELIRHCIAQLNFICANILSVTIDVRCVEMLNFLRNDQGKRTLSDLQLQSSQQCVLKVHDQRYQKITTKDYFQETKRAYCMISKFKVSIHVGCAASLTGDVLVNPFNADFKHYSSISAVIEEKGWLS